MTKQILQKKLQISLKIWILNKKNQFLPLIKSTLAAETVALSDTVDDEIYISDISELLFNGIKSLLIEIYIDSKSLYDAITSKKNVLEKKG